MKDKIKSILLYMRTKTWKHRHAFYVAVPFVIMDLLLRVFICDIKFFPAYYPIPNIFTLSWIVLFVGIIHSLRSRWGKILYWILFSVSYLVFITNTIYFSLTEFCFSFTLLEMSGEGSEYIMDAILGAKLWMYAVIILVLVVGIIAFKKMHLPDKFDSRGFIKTIAAFAIIHFIGVLALGPANSELKWNTFKNPRNIYDDFSDINKCMKVTGLYEYTIRNFYVTFLKPEEVINEEDKQFLDGIYANEGKNAQNLYTGIFEGKNLIFLQLEGMDNWLLDEETTPNLYALMKESINFTNHYSMYTGGGSTFNSEFAVNTGFITPISYIENVYSFHSNTFDYSMARMFKKLGYTINAFHMNSGEFYSRGLNYKSWGYDNYFGLVDIDKYKDNSHKLDRELILNSTFYNEMFRQEGKFVNYIITYSPHTPFTTEKEVGQLLAKMYYGEDEIPELTEEECARLMAGETDYMIGLLMEALKENGLYEDTVIVAFADHYLYTLEDKTVLEEYKTTENNLINHTPFFIWSSDLEPEEKNVVTMQTDILPTVLNLFGVEYNSNHYIGNDALAAGYKGYVFFSDYSWYDGNVYVVNGQITNGKKASEQYLEKMNENIGAIIRKNDLTLRYNYFKLMSNNSQ